ncbi:hypothetical protein DRO97_07945 [Archaeoglobales archaeon]|nr:MAG: hypothetical protein DRO97_07945 [Archaeoglobales archaeon]
MQAIKCGNVNSFECIRCGDCFEACKRKVLSFVSDKNRAKVFGFGLVVVLLILVVPQIHYAPTTPTTTETQYVQDYVHKEAGQVYVIPGLLGKDCVSCRSSSNPSKKDLTPFAIDWVNHGRNFEAIAKIDSDKDGFTNEEEWNGTNPADANSHP